MDDERVRWVQVFARLKPVTPSSATPRYPGLFTQSRAHEMTLPGANGERLHRASVMTESWSSRRLTSAIPAAQ